MKNQAYYKRLRTALDEWSQLGEANNATASMQVGIISGGIDLSEDWDKQEKARLLCVQLTECIVNNRGRLSVLLEMHYDYAFNKHGGQEIILNEIWDRSRI